MKLYTIKISFFLITLFFLYSCKKDVITQNEVSITSGSPKNNLKEWYSVQTKNGQPNYQTISFFLNISLPKWEETTYIDAENYYSTPVNDFTKAGCYKFLLTKTDDKGLPVSGKYVYVLVNKQQINLVSREDISFNFLSGKDVPAKFSGAIAEYDLQHQLISSTYFEKGQLIK